MSSRFRPILASAISLGAETSKASLAEGIIKLIEHCVECENLPQIIKAVGAVGATVLFPAIAFVGLGLLTIRKERKEKEHFEEHCDTVISMLRALDSNAHSNTAQLDSAADRLEDIYQHKTWIWARISGGDQAAFARRVSNELRLSLKTLGLDTVERLEDLRIYAEETLRKLDDVHLATARTESKVDAANAGIAQSLQGVTAIKEDVNTVREDIKTVITSQRTMETLLRQLQAAEEAQKAAGVAARPTEARHRTIKEAMRSRDPSERRVAYFMLGDIKMARSAHEAAKVTHHERPSEDARSRARAEFLDTIFEADVLRAEGKLTEALPYYRQACKLEPEDVLAAVSLVNAESDHLWVSLGEAWDRKPVDRDSPLFQSAFDLLERTTEAPTAEQRQNVFLPAAWAISTWAYQVAVRGYESQKATSLHALERAEAVISDDPVTLRLLARHWWVLERNATNAETYFKKAIEREPDSIAARLQYAVFLGEQGNREREMAAAFEACLDIDPDDPGTLCAYADFLALKPKTFPQAEAMWKHAIRVSPSYDIAWGRYAAALARTPDRSDDAENLFKQAMVARPNDPRLPMAYGEFLETLEGRDQDVIDAYWRAYELNPLDMDNAINHKFAELAAGKEADPETIGHRYIAVGAGRKDVRFHLAGAWLGILYGKSEEHAAALHYLRAFEEFFGPHASFVLKSRNIDQAVKIGHPYADWLGPLARVIAGQTSVSSLEGWGAWTAAAVPNNPLKLEDAAPSFVIHSVPRDNTTLAVGSKTRPPENS